MVRVTGAFEIDLVLHKRGTQSPIVLNEGRTVFHGRQLSVLVVNQGCAKPQSTLQVWCWLYKEPKSKVLNRACRLRASYNIISMHVNGDSYRGLAEQNRDHDPRVEHQVTSLHNIHQPLKRLGQS